MKIIIEAIPDFEDNSFFREEVNSVEKAEEALGRLERLLTKKRQADDSALSEDSL